MEDSLKVLLDSLIIVCNQTSEISKDTIYVSANNTDNWIPILISSFALLISLFAFIWKIRSENFTRKYQQLINKPSLILEYQFSDKDFRIYIWNSGLGLAIILDYKLYWGNQLVVHNTKFKQKLHNELPYITDYETLLNGTSIKTDEKIDIISFDSDLIKNATNEEKKMLLCKLKENLNVEINYRDIFGADFDEKFNIVI